MQSSCRIGRFVLLAAQTLTLALFTAALAAADVSVFAGRVVAVYDGDTIGVLRDGKEVRIRLEGIDCPERGQPFSKVAKHAASELVFNKLVVVEPKELDRYGRLVARVSVNGLDLSTQLVRRGLAWHFKRYSNDPALAAEEETAKRARHGLWIEPKPIPPWDWRR